MQEIRQLKELSSALAAELAAGIDESKVIFARFGVDPLRAVQLLKSEWFKDMVRVAKADWNGITNAKARVRLKARLALEESLPDIYAIVVDPKQSPVARVSAFRELKDLASVAQTQEAISPVAGLPSVTIVLGDRAPDITIDAKVTPSDPHPSVFPGLDMLPDMKATSK